MQHLRRIVCARPAGPSPEHFRLNDSSANLSIRDNYKRPAERMIQSPAEDLLMAQPGLPRRDPRIRNSHDFADPLGLVLKCLSRSRQPWWQALNSRPPSRIMSGGSIREYHEPAKQ